jgi:adenine-specific DNA-methyltransferase
MKDQARALRKNMTDAERILWRALRNRQLDGWKFRRQHPIGMFIVDFECVERKFIVEVDGGQHAMNVAEDARRSVFLRNEGYNVLRFWNNQVLQETDAVLDAILTALGHLAPSP